MFPYDSRIVSFFLFAFITFLQSCRLPGAPSETDPPFRAYFIDVGQGDACLLRTPGNRFSLYDIGNRSWILVPFLRKLRVDTLQSVIISHPDLDHYGAFTSLVREFPIKKVFLPNAASPDSTWQALLRSLDVYKVEKDTLFSGDSLAWEDGIRAKVLWPDKYFSGSKNDLSQVLRVEYRGHALLLTGDIESEAERGMLAARVNLTADILKVAHHGSRSSSGLPFLTSINPSWAVISCDSTVYGHPHAETMAALDLVMGDRSRILRTDREGTVEFAIDAAGLRRADDYP